MIRDLLTDLGICLAQTVAVTTIIIVIATIVL